ALLLSSPLFSLSFRHGAAPPAISTLSLHDALPISPPASAPPKRSKSSRAGPATRAAPAPVRHGPLPRSPTGGRSGRPGWSAPPRSEEHTSELQSRENLVCRLLLEKKKKKNKTNESE